MNKTAQAGSSGMLTLAPSIGARDWPAFSLAALARHGRPQVDASRKVNDWREANAEHLMRGLPALEAAREYRIATFFGTLWGRVFRGDGSVENIGLMGLRLVTTTGVGFIVDAFQNLVELEDMKYHGFGTGGSAEASGNTALTTELTTEYVVNSTRPTGTTTEASATVYRTVATLAPDSGGTLAITEHGVFSQAATGGGVMIDRTLFSAVNLVASSDSLQVTYDLTFTAGG